jgi:hypothetical protein
LRRRSCSFTKASGCGTCEQVAKQAARGLCGRDQIRASGDVARADLERLGGHAHVDALGCEIPRQACRHGRLGARQQDVFPRAGLLALGDGRAPVLEEVAEEPRAIARGRVSSRDSRVEVMHDALPVGQRGVVVTLEDEPASGRLLVGHADGAVEDRPRLAVARIERVVHLADEVREAAVVESRGGGAAEGLEPADLIGRDEWVQRIGRRREVVGRVAAHLVEVDDDVREVVERDLQPAARLGLRLREPVAVHVEEVVIGSPARPRLVVLGAEPFAVGRRRATELVLEEEASPAIGIFERVDEDDRLAKDRVDHRVAAGGEQVICLGEGGVGRGDLVAVNGMHEPGDDGKRVEQPVGVTG